MSKSTLKHRFLSKKIESEAKHCEDWSGILDILWFQVGGNSRVNFFQSDGKLLSRSARTQSWLWSWVRELVSSWVPEFLSSRARELVSSWARAFVSSCVRELVSSCRDSWVNQLFEPANFPALRNNGLFLSWRPMTLLHWLSILFA